MSTIVEVINSFDPKSKKYEEFLQYLLSHNGDVPFDTDEVDSVQSAIISAVNSRLNQALTRCNGLTILDKILPQCSRDILAKYCLLWLGKATQVLESIHSSPQDLKLSCKVIGNLLIQSKNISEIQKQIYMQNVKQLINIITSLDFHRISSAVYYLIAVLLFHYPEVSERFQVSLKKVIFLHIDSTDSSLVNASAKCYALLAKATERSFKPLSSKPLYTCWTYNQALVCNSLQSIMDELFSSLIELQNVDIWDKLDLSAVPEDNIVDVYSTYRQRFMNLCSYLSFMLRGWDTKNSVSIQDVLQVICRGLTITPLNLKNKNTVREQMLYLMLPQLHTSLLHVLDSLIIGFKEQLVSFGSTILQLFHRTLQWTDTVLEDKTTITSSKPFKNVRIAVYQSLTSWLVNMNSMSGIETVADEYLPSILKDIVPERNRVLLTIQKTQNLSKRAQKRLRDSQYEKSVHLNNGTETKEQSDLDADVCHEALIVLQNVFFSGGQWLKQTFFKAVQNMVIPILYDCYLSSYKQKFYMTNAACRLQLLRVLRSLQINPHLLLSSPTQYSIELFELALNDDDLLVNHEAKIALAEVEKIVHPAAPSLQLAQLEKVQKEFVSNDGNNQNVILEDVHDTSDNNNDDIFTPSANKRLKSTGSSNAVEHAEDEHSSPSRVCSDGEDEEEIRHLFRNELKEDVQ